MILFSCANKLLILWFLLDLRKTILIPILYKSCEIPRKLQIFTRLDYTNDRERPYFWKKLAASLGYSNKCNGKT